MATRARLAVAATLVLVSACSTQTILENVWNNRQYLMDTVERPFTVAQARDTFLLKSSDIFYPQGIPDDPGRLPALSEQNIRQIEAMLAHVMAQVASAEARHRNLLAARWERADPSRTIKSLRIVDQPRGVAATEASGQLFLNLKVVQAIYRSALISELSTGREHGGSREEKEKEVLRTFGQFKEQLAQMSPALPLSDIKRFAAGAHQDTSSNPLDNVMAGAGAVLVSRLTDMTTVGQSASLERSFLGAIGFLIAHETGHLALGHFPLATSCQLARTREFDADRYAVLLNILADSDGAPKLVMTHTSDTSMTISGLGGSFFGGDAKGYEQFFEYAYGLSDFEGTFSNIPGCEYPAPAERKGAVEGYANLLTEFISSARWADGIIRSGSDAFKKGESPFDYYYEDHRSKEETMLRQVEDTLKSKAQPTSYDVNRVRTLRANVNELVDYRAHFQDVFYEYCARPQ